MTQLTNWEKERQYSVDLSGICTDIFLAEIAIKHDGDGRLDSHNVLRTLKQRRDLIEGTFKAPNV